MIATGNPGKSTRIHRSFWGAAGYDVRTLKDYPALPDVEEAGTTFEENARLKAKRLQKFLGDLF